MLRRRHRFVALLLIPIMLSALCWSVSASALADQVAADAAFAALESGEADGMLPDVCGAKCNHGCHIAGHLLGQPGGMPRAHVTPPPTVVPQAPSFELPLNSPDNPFRPPSTPSLA